MSQITWGLAQVHKEYELRAGLPNNFLASFLFIFYGVDFVVMTMAAVMVMTMAVMLVVVRLVVALMGNHCSGVAGL